MKINNAFLVHDDGKDKILVSTGEAEFSGLVRANSTAGFIIDRLVDGVSESKIVSEMLARYDVTEDVALCDVRKVVAQLRKIGAIDE